MTEIETFRDEVATHELRWKCWRKVDRHPDGTPGRWQIEKTLQQKWKVAYGTGGSVVYKDEWRDIREEWES